MPANTGEKHLDMPQHSIGTNSDKSSSIDTSETGKLNQKLDSMEYMHMTCTKHRVTDWNIIYLIFNVVLAVSVGSWQRTNGSIWWNSGGKKNMLNIYWQICGPIHYSL